MTRDEFKKLISEKLVILDGATGTELVKRGMPSGVSPELWCLENPHAVLDLQRAYIDAGSDIVYSPTFGGTRFKLANFGLAERLGEINRGLAEISKKAAGDKFVFGDLAPTGLFIEPFGDISFDDAVQVYGEQAKWLLEGGVDGFVIETMMDIQEARAALIAVRELCELPVMVSMTYEADRRTLNGTDPITALVTLQALGADVVGCNCSTGPDDMIEVISMMKEYATVPLLAKPNAGMPKLIDGKTLFDMEAEKFGSFVSRFIEAGVNVLGGCCGTTPEHIAALAAEASGKCGRVREVGGVSVVTSSRKYTELGVNKPFVVIGERINPTGKKALQEELRQGKTSLVQDFALDQQMGGAEILDVNMGLSGIDEREMMVKSVNLLSRSSELPLCIDSTRPEVVEAALRVYPGRAMVNSISGERERIEKTLPIAAKYGAMFILLPLDDSGIPATLDARKAVVNHVFAQAQKYGYTVEDIAVDGLVMTISSDNGAALVSLDLMEWAAREMGFNTTCGLSNVSFGLPAREGVNSNFLAMAMSRGATTAIANPSSQKLMDTVAACDALRGMDKNLLKYIERFSGEEASAAGEPETLSPKEMVFNSVLRGWDDRIEGYIKDAIGEGIEPQSIVDDCLIPAITEVGERFDRKEYFLPQLIMSADTMRKGFSVLEPLLREEGEVEPKGRVVIATVKGDIHDIGKNIVALMLRNYGFQVIDLGKDVEAEEILSGADEAGATIIILSALMTTTMVEMKTVIELSKNRGCSYKFMIGGAVVDQNYADEIGADGYSGDALEAVRLAERLLK